MLKKKRENVRGGIFINFFFVDYGFGFLFPSSCIYFFLKNKFNNKMLLVITPVPCFIRFSIIKQREDFDNLLAWWTKSWVDYMPTQS